VYSGKYIEYDIQIDKSNITLVGIPYELGSGNDTGKPIIIKEVNQVELIRIDESDVTVDGFIMKDTPLPPMATNKWQLWY